jgi:hypothetical protein
MRLAQLLDEPAVEAGGVGLRRLLYQVREGAEHGAVGDGRGLDRHGEAISGGDELALPRELQLDVIGFFHPVIDDRGDAVLGEGRGRPLRVVQRRATDEAARGGRSDQRRGRLGCGSGLEGGLRDGRAAGEPERAHYRGGAEQGTCADGGEPGLRVEGLGRHGEAEAPHGRRSQHLGFGWRGSPAVMLALSVPVRRQERLGWRQNTRWRPCAQFCDRFFFAFGALG